MTRLIINEIQTNYSINENGEIFNNKTQKFLKGSIKNGYLMVKLTINGVKKDYCVHRLVAQTFLPNLNNLPQVNHKDRNKLNNCVNNLEWVTGSQNMIHVNETGKKSRQPIANINEIIDEEHGWKQYKDTNYWFNKNGKGANIKTNKYLNASGPRQDGYLRYYLYINKERKVFLAHRLIYETFFNDLTPKDQINHIDGNKNNNCLNNLEKVSRSENMQHSFYVLRKNIKPIIQYDLNYNIIKEYNSMSEAARELGIDCSGISQACSGQLLTYKNSIWKYKQ